MSSFVLRIVLVSLLTLTVGSHAQQPAQAPAVTMVSKNDYRDSRNWLCRPGRAKSEADACNVDLSTTVVNADGKLTVEKFVANPAAPIDCFYVYPTVSLDPTPNSDMQAGPEELSVVQQQFARFASQCRVFAPLYRQISLTALQAMVTGAVMKIDGALGYNDVLDAWNDYLQHDNQGRGVVLIGHSQGASVLTQLIAKEVDGKPVQARLVSAMLLGWNVSVPKGAEVGGVFQSIPLCRTDIQTGCVLTYASFRANSPPPANSRFGRIPGDKMQSACTNPAMLKGGSASLHAYLVTTTRNNNSAAESAPWVSGTAPITTPFVSVPGLLSAECVVKEGASYLAVTVNANSSDPRVDDIAGDVVSKGVVQKDWGLHLIDMNLAMGNLVHIVGEQSKGYLKTCNCKQ
ncbi:MAG: DUF3089 domain-containing protein [Candidatus Obscuribacterales bacterium]|nr:DUF3089 domain-containing protein [Steroidobacteraceae bacterium]